MCRAILDSLALARALSGGLGWVNNRKLTRDFFLSFRARRSYFIQRSAARTVSFADKNNRIRIEVSRGAAFSAAAVRSDLAVLRSADPSFQASSPTRVALPGGVGFKVTYPTRSAPNPVTNKRITLAVDRYYLSTGGKRAIIDLGAPKGVDNVDAFRLIIRSFRWR